MASSPTAAFQDRPSAIVRGAIAAAVPEVPATPEVPDGTDGVSGAGASDPAASALSTPRHTVAEAACGGANDLPA